MKKFISGLAFCLLSITVILTQVGCSTSPLKIRIVPLKIEINQPEPAPVLLQQRLPLLELKPVPPVIPTQR